MAGAQPLERPHHPLHDQRRLIQKRTFGTGGLAVSALGLGCMGVTGAYSVRPDRTAMIALLRSAVDQQRRQREPGARGTVGDGTGHVVERGVAHDVTSPRCGR
jgi:hypothetical protein